MSHKRRVRPAPSLEQLKESIAFALETTFAEGWNCWCKSENNEALNHDGRPVRWFASDAVQRTLRGWALGEGRWRQFDSVPLLLLLQRAVPGGQCMDAFNNAGSTALEDVRGVLFRALELADHEYKETKCRT